MLSNKISIVSGGFDPLHVGHIDLFNNARELSDALFVILNTDRFLFEKKGRVFMPFEERKIMVESVKGVDIVVPCIDADNTVCKTLEKLSSLIEAVDAQLLFCNGGDRTTGKNTPEHEICKKLNIETVYGLGDKIQSSSWLTK